MLIHCVNPAKCSKPLRGAASQKLGLTPGWPGGAALQTRPFDSRWFCCCLGVVCFLRQGLELAVFSVLPPCCWVSELHSLWPSLKYLEKIGQTEPNLNYFQGTHLINSIEPWNFKIILPFDIFFYIITRWQLNCGDTYLSSLWEPCYLNERYCPGKGQLVFINFLCEIKKFWRFKILIW